MSKLSLREQNAKGRTHRCEVPGCQRLRRGVSRYCFLHENRKSRHGHPNGRHLRAFELAPFREELDRWLKAQDGHPVLQSVYAELDEMLSRCAAYEPGRSLRHYDADARMKLELRRLASAGITGKQIFRTAAVLWRVAKCRGDMLPFLSIQHRYATARHVLNLTPRYYHYSNSNSGSRKKVSRRLSSQVLNSLGRHLIVSLRVVLEAVHEAIEKSANAERDRAERLTADLTAHPFS